MQELRSIHHYHGTPIWGNKGEVLKHAVSGAGAFVSYARPDQMNQCLKWADAVGIDNGAFSAWMRGLKLDWVEFYKWLMKYYFNEKVKFFIIPDQVDGDENDNNKLIKSVPVMFREKATPVWHLHESLDKLDWLCSEYERVAFGSSEQYRSIRSPIWRTRMDEAFNLMVKKNHATKIHGLRMLDGRVLGNYPLTTADSTNLATNVPKYRVKHIGIGRHIAQRPKVSRILFDKHHFPYREWSMHPDDKSELLLHRCACLKGAIEKVKPPTLKEWELNNVPK